MTQSHTMNDNVGSDRLGELQSHSSAIQLVLCTSRQIRGDSNAQIIMNSIDQRNERLLNLHLFPMPVAIAQRCDAAN